MEVGGDKRRSRPREGGGVCSTLCESGSLICSSVSAHLFDYGLQPLGAVISCKADVAPSGSLTSKGAKSESVSCCLPKPLLMRQEFAVM